MAEQLKKLGRYTLLDRLAEGGTAEVYRGLMQNGEGKPRLVAIKALHREHSDDTTFLDFIREETKLTQALCHPNIVQTLDFGEENGRPFIVFEYMHGRSLKQIVDRLADLSRPLQVEFATFIAEQSAGALHYGHVFEDPTTHSVINIIHRDVSPHNIMVSYDGIPKLIDFGIAKVLQRETQTKAGIIKGKPAYLSPEQATLRPIDARSDIFALGTVLWEALTGRRLFGGMEKAATLRAISDANVVIAPPSMINPSVSPELDAIVLKALERDRERRFKSAHEMQVQLHQTLQNKNRETHHRELSALLGLIFAREIERERAELQRLGAEVEKITRQSVSDPSWLIPAVMPAVSRGGLKATPIHNELTMNKFEVRAKPAVELESPKFGTRNRVKSRSSSKKRPRSSRVRQLALGGIFATVAAAAFLVFVNPGSQPPPPPPPPVPAPVETQAAAPPPPKVTRKPASTKKKSPRKPASGVKSKKKKR